MCGVAGFIGKRPVPKEQINRCLMAMKRRGPDNLGYYTTEFSDGTVVQLLHSRLSVLDLHPRSDQPFLTKRSALVMNGEIYNYVELRGELLKQGICIETEGDTEVAVRLLELKGPHSVQDFEAMFAFCWVDHEAETVLLARDRFGEKPLLFAHSPQGTYFGSTPQFIAALRDTSLDVNPDLISRFIVNGYKDVFKQESTFFRDLQRVPAGGGLLRSACGTWSTVSLTDKIDLRVDEAMTFAEAASGTLARVVQAVDLRLRADVPIALCLSGGIDSSLLLGVIRNVLKRDVQTFSIVGSDPRYDESSAIFASADWFGITPHVTTMTGFDCLSILEAVTLERGSPVATANQFALWSLMREVSSMGYKVVISGVGADEFFTGYYDHHLYYLHSLAASDPDLSHQKRLEWEAKTLPLVRNPQFRDPDRDFASLDVLSSLVFGDTSSRRSYLKDIDPAQFVDLSWGDERYDDELLRNRMSNELWRETVPLMLHEEDQNAMFWGVENRSPYLDSHILAWSRTIPLRHLIQDGYAKAPLRAAAVGLVPDFVIKNRRKTGFNLSVADLLPRNRQTAVDYVGDSALADLIDIGRVSSLLKQEVFDDSENKLAFSLLSSAAFMRVFV